MARTDLTALSAVDAAAAIAQGQVTAEEMTQACLDRIAEGDGEIGAFIHLDPEHALERARDLDKQKLYSHSIGPLHGVPVAIKDIYDTADYPTECGSPLLSGRRPTEDSTVVARLKQAGAVIIGKTVTTEFAYFHPGKTRNPHDTSRTPGGSSSGSAAAVAAGMVPLSIGSQTNGSMIRPAAYCGIYGIKPSFGMVSRAGALPLSRTLDHVGGYARTLGDIALLMDVLVGVDSADPDTRPYGAPSFRKTAASEPPVEPRYAFVRTPVWDKADEEARKGIEDLAKEVGAEEVELPAGQEAWGALRAIMATEMAHNLGMFLDKGEVSQQFRDLLEYGRSVTATQYLAAVRDAKRYAEATAAIFEQVADAVLTLSATGVAPQGTATGDPAFCTYWTLTGLPALNLPILMSDDDLPIGVQLVGAARGDERLLRNAAAFVKKVSGGA